jgi:sigma-B regulation protein RsbU (phosphoserine phosphatase)
LAGKGIAPESHAFAQLHRERVEKEKMERDLALAREIQAGFLPDAPPVFPGIEIAVSHRASQMAGGDYHDFLPVQVDGAEALLLVVADVEGKGAASALVMANVQATLHALADHVGPLEKLPATINHKLLMGARALLALGRATKYLSMFLALVERGGRNLRYVNAGHVPPAVIRADGRVEWLDVGGMIVGLLPDVQFECGALWSGRPAGGLHGRDHRGHGRGWNGIQPSAPGRTRPRSARPHS